MSPAIERSPFLTGVTPYETPPFATPVDLYLNGNEGIAPPKELLEALSREGGEALRRYPHAETLEAEIAAMIGTSPEQVVVTAGADDALARVMRAVLAPGREMILPVPTFEMLERYALLTGGRVVTVPWLEGPYPVDAVLEATNERTALITAVTPNSPTGLVATLGDLERLSEAAPRALLLVDLAYVDFAAEDITKDVLAFPNAVLTRTLSKAWGLAGLRVGWAAGPREIIDWLRAAGQPYSVSSPSLILAEERIRTGREDMARFTSKVREQRGPLLELLERLGAPSTPSEGNYVFPRHKNSEWIRDALAGLGIAVRAFPGKKYLEDGLRITVPGDDAAFRRLCHGLESALAPEALFFDIDDTLADVSESYRGAIIATAALFGVTVTPEEITARKTEGDANNDWVLTRKILSERGVRASLDDVTARFEEIYQGTKDKPGLKATETLLVPRELLERLAGRIRLGVVTGRPMSDALDFLKAQGIEHLFSVLATMEDSPPKPHPAPVRAALTRLGISCAWMVGDTPDDIRSARAAGVVPIGVVAPADPPEVARPALIRAGAGRVLEDLSELEELLP